MKKYYIGLIILFFFTGGIYLFSNIKNNKIEQDVTEVAETKLVHLKNNDTYNLKASFVNKIVGGVNQRMLAYNGSIPGPTIEVTEGDEITINFTNETDTNQLLHSHGVRMENLYDGTHLVQKEMRPGETFSYKLKFPDVGIYWYHPHVDEVYGQARGLYGAFVVKPKSKNYFPQVNREVSLFLSDILIQNNQIETKASDNDYQLMGHYGNVLLTNGKEDYKLEAKAGEVIRLYIVNAANARPFNFKINGAQMKLIGGDSGAYEKASFVDSVILGPSERAIVDVLFEKSGSYSMENITPNRTYHLGKVLASNRKIENSFKGEFLTLQSNPEVIESIEKFRGYFDILPDKKINLTIDMMSGNNMMQSNMSSMRDRNQHNNQERGGEQMINLMGIQMTKEQAIEHCQLMPKMKGCEPYLNITNTSDNSKNNKINSNTDGIEWEDEMSMMNQMSNQNMIQWKIIDEETKNENMDINWIFKKDQPVKIRIYNDPNSAHPMQHPIHFHGQRFLVVSHNGVKQTNLVWKDTALVRTGETVEIILDPTNLGDWMAHCHISEHLANGMAFTFEVKD